MNTIHWVRTEREQSLLKSRQFLFKATLVFLPELLSSGLVPSNFFIACWETHLDWKEIQALASLVHAMQRGRGRSCAGEASWWEGKPCFVVFADLLGVNTPTLTGFKLLTWLKAQLGRDVYNGLSRAGGIQCSTSLVDESPYLYGFSYGTRDHWKQTALGLRRAG